MNRVVVRYLSKGDKFYDMIHNAYTQSGDMNLFAMMWATRI